MNTVPDTNPTVPCDPPSSPTALPAVPGYELLELVGRGGMGKVYRAKSLTLGRVVALKLLAHEPDEKALARFRDEARAVARLQHPNIAQVFETGFVEGSPFYTQEFLEGGSLAQSFAGEPQEPRVAAKLIEAVARGVQHSHENGILHRDLKPANVLLAADGTPKVTDFGLAKYLASPEGTAATASGGDGLTRTGEILGTPGYMPPEQASGSLSNLGPPTDVYALGAMLYEALTGRPPFRSPDPFQTVYMVLSMEPVSPRVLQPNLPRDLETICLKCLEKSPRKRYSSADELADDLKRFLNSEPILARPVGFFERSAKWARRKPWQAIATALGGFLMLGLVVGFVWMAEKNRQVEDANTKLGVTNTDLENTNHQLAAAKQATDQANQALKVAKDEAEQTLSLALKSLDDYYFQFYEKLREVPRGEKLRIEVLGQARATLARIHTFRPDNPDIRAFQIEGYDKLGNAEMAVGDVEGATADYRSCREIAGELEARFPDDPNYRRYRALADLKLATADRLLGNAKAADERLTQARPAVTGLVAAFPNDPRVWELEFALALESLGGALRTGDPDAAETHTKRLTVLARKLAAASPGNTARAVAVVDADARLALLLTERDKLDDAGVEIQRAVEGLATLPDPGPVPVRTLRGTVYGNLGWYHDRRKQPKEAAAAYRKSASAYAALSADFPNSPLYRYQEAECRYYQGVDELLLLNPTEGVKLIQQAHGLAKELSEAYPKDPRYSEQHKRIASTLDKLRPSKEPSKKP